MNKKKKARWILLSIYVTVLVIFTVLFIVFDYNPFVGILLGIILMIITSIISYYFNQTRKLK